MSEIVYASIGSQKYKTHIRTKRNTIIADEPMTLGGSDLGLTPTELLCASLAACTCITLRTYADRKEFLLTEIHVTVQHHLKDDTTSELVRTISFVGPLQSPQIEQLLTIADNCPVYLILSHTISITTTFKTP